MVPSESLRQPSSSSFPAFPTTPVLSNQTFSLVLQILIIVLYTISNLAITSLFPVRTQALAGGVFNTLAQIGNSVGLAVTSIVAASVTGAKSAAAAEGTSTQGGILALWEGYKASFWTCFAACVVSGMICAGGMRGLGKVGLKVE
jgi:Na+-transporting methylmalonyl-CoA/oxaloacetate decarboxylase gamma subunit